VSDRSGDPAGERTGSVGEEAAKLLQALQEWARDGAGDATGATASAAAAAASAAHRINEHLATGGPECRYCPLCQVIAAVRGTSPEVRQHLTTAATSLMHVVAALLATPVPDQDAAKPDAVQRIDLDDEWEDD
jgi:hypothetical protein